MAKQRTDALTALISNTLTDFGIVGPTNKNFNKIVVAIRHLLRLPEEDRDKVFDWLHGRDEMTGEWVVIPRELYTNLEELAKQSAEVMQVSDALLLAEQSLERSLPALATHRKWDKWRAKEELSFGQIVQRHKDETGEEVTRDAVIKGIKRYRIRYGRDDNS